jgi:glycosyltransferase involved in cell wall biosynthesis
MLGELIRDLADRVLFRRRHEQPARKPGGARHLLVDVSVICRHDAGTGIQRVVRAFWAQICTMAPDDFVVVPVFANKRHGYCYAPADFLENDQPPPAASPLVAPGSGDLFLGLDLSARALPRHKRQIDAWKAAGMTVHIMVYDLLPVSGMGWFPAKVERRFSHWLDFVATRGDQALCISRHVADELRAWLIEHHPGHANRIQIDCVPLGGDIAQSLPTSGLPADIDDIAQDMRARPTILMVGTIEPRKGYDQALDAFELLWRDHPDTAPSLFIAGRPGWMTTALQKRIRGHAQAGRHLRWFSDASDEMIDRLYRESTGVLVASRAEGYGLPVAEGLGHGKPVLARDLPVFREFECAGLQYFDALDAAGLASAIIALINKDLSGASSSRITVPTWSACTAVLLQTLGVAKPCPRPAEGNGTQ